MKNLALIISLCSITLACSKEKYFDGPNYFEENFETYSQYQQLLPAEDQLWSYTQITLEGSNITVDSTFAHTGNKSLKFFGVGTTEETLSKCSITKQKMAFWEGETVRLTGWYYLQSTDTLDGWLFLMDLEEQAAIGAGPGMRIAMVENKLRIEHKFNEKDILQTPGQEVEFPRNQWVEIVWEIKLSQKTEGTVKLYQNGELIINTTGNTTLPKDLLYFQQGTKGMYSSCEIGLTANGSSQPLTLFVDDVKFEKVN